MTLTLTLTLNRCNAYLDAVLHPRAKRGPNPNPNPKPPPPPDHRRCNVYLDSVLHPRAKKDPMVLQQEGWHYELETPDAPLT